MDIQLHRLYAENRAPIAFLDESYELREGKTFYIIASAIVYPDDLDRSRTALLEFYGGDTMHASPMYRRNELTSLRSALSLAASQHDGMDVVVQTAVDLDDDHGHSARRRCLSFIAPLLHKEEGTTLFVLDSLETPAANRHDRFTFGDLRRAGTLHRDATEYHARPSAEPLLGLPDLLAWAYRQQITRNDASWFAPLARDTRVHELEGG
ncbi:hypothetical protein ACXR2T_11095 [Leucobacter sp. HY1910]